MWVNPIIEGLLPPFVFRLKGLASLTPEAGQLSLEQSYQKRLVALAGVA